MSFNIEISIKSTNYVKHKPKKKSRSKSGKRSQITQSKLGREVKKVRVRLGMPQISFAKWMSAESGEEISSLMICRIENYGFRDACSPIKPSSAVIEILLYMNELDKEVEEELRRYESMKLMEQPGDTVTEKMLNTYRSSDMLPPEFKDLKNEDILKKVVSEDDRTSIKGAT